MDTNETSKITQTKQVLDEEVLVLVEINGLKRSDTGNYSPFKLKLFTTKFILIHPIND